MFSWSDTRAILLCVVHWCLSVSYDITLQSRLGMVLHNSIQTFSGTLLNTVCASHFDAGSELFVYVHSSARETLGSCNCATHVLIIYIL